MQDSGNALTRAATGTGRWLLALPTWMFLSGALALFALKSTFFWSGSFFYLEAANFPRPVTQLSTNFIPLLIHKAAPEIVSLTLLPLSVVSLGVASFLLYRYLVRDTRDREFRRIAVIWVLSWPAVTAVLPWLGNGTAFLPLFVAMAVCTYHWSWRIIGIVGASLTHPEQAFLAFGLLALLSSVDEYRSFRKIALFGTAIAGIVTMVAAAWVATEPVASRTPLLAENFLLSVRFSARYGLLGTYTWWGVWWLLIMIALVVASRRARALLLIVGIAVPGIFAFITDNYTRVFAGVALAVGVAVVIRVGTSVQESLAKEGVVQTSGRNLGFWALAFLLLPNLNFMMPGDGTPTPGAYWIGLIENNLVPYLNSVIG